MLAVKLLRNVSGMFRKLGNGKEGFIKNKCNIFQPLGLFSSFFFFLFLEALQENCYLSIKVLGMTKLLEKENIL